MTTPAPKRGPGRPPLSEGEATRALYVRLPASVLEALAVEAEARGERTAEYARRVLTESVRRDARSREACDELTRMGQEDGDYGG